MLEQVRHAWTLPAEELHEINGYQVKRNGRLMLLHRPENSELNNVLHVIAYPKPEHLQQFADAVKTTLKHGPGYRNPGSVGSLEMRKRTEKSEFVVAYIQGHFKIGRPAPFISPELAREYANWKIKILREALEFAKAQGKSVIIPEVILQGALNTKRGTTRMRQIQHAIQLVNGKYEENKDGYYEGIKISFE
ncbi:MAG: hypothetical protein V1644_03535 [Candidatus Micrarchaeota archaeon]